jgi:glycerol-1-phosphate dehydrogenase [NAD(P)+]
MKIWSIPTIMTMPFQEVEETRPVILLTSGPAWHAVRSRLGLPVIWQGEVTQADKTHWDHLVDDIKPSISYLDAVIYAVGGGLVADAAKYLSFRLGLPLTCLPTALSVDAYFTWVSALRQAGCVHYLETRPADYVIIDWEVIGSAPASLRAAGICDALSLATGVWDWQLAEERGKNPPEMAYQPSAANLAGKILENALLCAEAAGAGDPDGLKQLLDCLVLETQLCNLLGHSRPQEGSEHYYAYAIEENLGHGLPHADQVGPGIVLIAGFQGQAVDPLVRALEDCHISLDSMPKSVVESLLHQLPAYVQKHDLPYGIAHELGNYL